MKPLPIIPYPLPPVDVFLQVAFSGNDIYSMQLSNSIRCLGDLKEVILTRLKTAYVSPVPSPKKLVIRTSNLKVVDNAMVMSGELHHSLTANNVLILENQGYLESLYFKPQYPIIKQVPVAEDSKVQRSLEIHNTAFLRQSVGHVLQYALHSNSYISHVEYRGYQIKRYDDLEHEWRNKYFDINNQDIAVLFDNLCLKTDVKYDDVAALEFHVVVPALELLVVNPELCSSCPLETDIMTNYDEIKLYLF